MLKTRNILCACRFFALLAILSCLTQNAFTALAQSENPAPFTAQSLTFSTGPSTTHRFIAAHGRRALLDGDGGGRLEAWIYPFQIFRGYRIAFRVDGSTTAIDGEEILARVEYAPDSITRVYLGPNFVAREKLFVPLDRPGVILTYTVASARKIEIEVNATPVLNLMWPAALGGQSFEWNSPLGAFVLSEPADSYTAVIGSPDIVAHDAPGNRTMQPAGGAEVGFTLRPNEAGHAAVYATLNAPHAPDVAATFRGLIHDRDLLQAEAAEHYRKFAESVLQVTTPDPIVNQDIAWAEVALDQAWVCNTNLGCGYVGGFGPSRGARRPQYDLFFAGDGLVAADGAISMGDTAHARDEILFVLRYQDAKTGMIWHELSQSAGLIDWVGKYPYMYVHVDITFQFLATLGRYVAATGDTGFVRDHWQSIQNAYRYCQSLIDPATSLPRIPDDKEGGNEQNRMSDDLGLSTSWISASSSFARFATIAGQTASAEEAIRASQAARNAIPARYWNDAASFWISGHTTSGKPMPERRSGPAEALNMHLFSTEHNDSLLNQLASTAFQTDWGTRGIGADSDGFDPESYAQGSVWPVATAALADAFWNEQRPVTAFGIWRSLLPLTSVDSFGHMPEVLAGNYYRPQTESVPEQTWSSASFLEAATKGLLGLQVDSIANRVDFAPRIPVTWADVSIQNIHLSGRSISVALHQSAGCMDLRISNPGGPFHLLFSPDLPLGATLLRSLLNHQPVAGKTENYLQQTTANIELDAPHGDSEIELYFAGGISVVAEEIQPQLGNQSEGIRVVGARLNGNTLSIDADVPTDRASHLQLYTGWKLTGDHDIKLQQTSPAMQKLIFPPTPGASATYRRAHATLRIER
jgi:hypothetical protein